MLSLIRDERPADAAAIDQLLDDSFGVDRQRRAVSRLRLAEPEQGLCLVAESADGFLLGNLRFWSIRAGAVPSLLLGPLAVRAERRGEGIGRALVRAGLDRAAGGGHGLVLVSGDPAYYRPFGFVSAPSLIAPAGLSHGAFLALDLGAGVEPAGPVRAGRGVRGRAAGESLRTAA